MHEFQSDTLRKVSKVNEAVMQRPNGATRSHLFSTQRRRGAEALEILRGREGIAIDALE